MENVTESDEEQMLHSKNRTSYKISNTAFLLVLIYSLLPIIYSFAITGFNIMGMVFPLIFLIIDVVMILSLFVYRKYEKEIIPGFLFILSGLILSILDIQTWTIVQEQMRPFIFSLSIPIFMVGVVLMLNKWEHEKSLEDEYPS